MKTSFYFVVWILIYPILDLLHNQFIENNAFIVAFAAVWGLSWLLNRLIPKTLYYEKASQIAPVLEDVYTGNVASFTNRIVRESTEELITAIYFALTTIVCCISVFLFGAKDWITLIVFAFFTIGTIGRTVSLMKVRKALEENPTSEECMEIATETLKLDYAAYYEQRINTSYADILPPRPRHFKAFQIFSLVVAAIASLLGLFNTIFALLILFGFFSVAAGAIAGMYFLYGSLAIYYGVRDIISISRNLKAR